MTQAELICLAGVCGTWVVHLWYGLSPVVLAAGPGLMQRRMTFWYVRCGYIMALGQLLLGYVAGVYPACMVLAVAGLGVGLYVRLALRDGNAAPKGR